MKNEKAEIGMLLTTSISTMYMSKGKKIKKDKETANKTYQKKQQKT